ncbi:hypothetical protein C8R45DRAFT_1060321 [Mycena sanguinolenta]|nr:hypothetical protein C8R45DRAFT_1060321 [Mycena sanguinolenta]
MRATVRDLILILQIFFPAELSLHKAFYVCGVIISLYPLLRLHLNQQRQPHQPSRTAWAKSIFGFLKAASELEDQYPPIWATGLDRGEEYAQHICDELGPLYMILGLNPHNLDAPTPEPLFLRPRVILCSSRLSCMFSCVWVLDASMNWVEADLVIAHCASCRADYFPDRITYKDANGGRCQRLELSPEYLRVSKHGIWVHKQIAQSQENAVHRFHAAWANFAEWHFARRLLLFHNKPDFSCEAHPSTRLLAEAVRATIGVNGGVLEMAMDHGCIDCGPYCSGCRTDNNDGNPEGVPFPPPSQHDVPLPGEPRGYVRMVVMDGKTIPHQCERPLVNYRNGRFCEVHLNLQEKCGIIPCGLPVRQVGVLTCAADSHIQWERQYTARFLRLTFPGVRRVIRQQQGLADNQNAHGHGPTLRVSPPALGQYTYCLQTVQLACGYPVGWGKCYRSESSRQVVAILNCIWENHPNSRPSFVAYDDAYNLLRHIIQNRNDPWISSTKFIVDARWSPRDRYVVPCGCNPAPKNGSQPDLVLVEQDANGVQHQTRAFNTETAEQLNSWLNGFESQLRHMSDVNDDFFVHVLMMIYAERVEKKVTQRQLELSDDFWVQAAGG